MRMAIPPNERGRRMPHYRIYLLERSGRSFSERGTVFANDKAAITGGSANTAMYRLAAEVWCGTRLVFRLAPVATVLLAANPAIRGLAATAPVGPVTYRKAAA